MAAKGDTGRERHAVLNVFGLTLQVSNPRLAELLTMDAREALGTDMRDLVVTSGAQRPPAEQVRETLTEVAEVLPDVRVTVPSPHTEQADTTRRDFRARAESLGAALGFQTCEDGLWRSASGIGVMTRTVERPISLAAAAHFVSRMAMLQAGRVDADTTSVLFIVEGSATVEVFEVAIRERRLYHVMRTVAIDDLDEMRALARAGALSHEGTVALLAPVTDIDVGRLLSVLRGCRAADSQGSGVS